MFNKTHYKATMILFLLAAGYFLTLEIHKSFWGGLINSAFAAGMVGGLADWFAVTALFKRPLGIKMGTEVVLKNRERLSQAFVDMLTEEVFSSENMKRVLDAYDLSGDVIKYLNCTGGRKEFKRTLLFVLQHITMDDHNKGPFAGFLRMQLDKIYLTPAFKETLKVLLARGHDKTIYLLLVGEFKHLISSAAVKRVIAKLFVQVLRDYERGMIHRRVFDKMLFNAANISPLTAATTIQQGTIKLLDQLADVEHPMYSIFQRKLFELVENLSSDSPAGQKLEGLKYAVAETWRKLYPQMTFKMRVIRIVCKVVDGLIDEFCTNTQLRAKLNRYASDTVITLVRKHQDKIANIALETLKRLPDKELVRVLEVRVGNDLQMIRINGSIVGAVAGALIYLMHAGIGRILAYAN